jgi:hypothetical protein
MNISKKNTTFLIAGAIVVLGLVAYFVWMRPSSGETITITDGPVSSAQAVFLQLADQLEPITFDARVLADPRFIGLVDIKTTIVPEASGRNDPFAPLPGIALE